MNTMKKAFAVLLVLAIAMSLSVAAFASVEFKIEVTNNSAESNATIASQDFTAYQVFKVQYTGMDVGSGTPSGTSGAAPSYSYSIADALAGWEYDTTPNAEGGEVSDDALIAYVSGLGTDHDALQAFAQAALEKLAAIEKAGTNYEGHTASSDEIALAKKIVKASATADESFPTAAESVTIPCVEAGYYLVKGTAMEGTNSLITACSLSTTNPKATVRAKVVAPKPVKTVNNGSVDVEQLGAQIGQDLPFKVTAKVPNMEGYKGYLLGFNDKMSAGLTLADLSLAGLTKNFSVKIAVADGTTPYEITVTNITSEVDTSLKDDALTQEFDTELNAANDCNLYYDQKTGEMKLRIPDLKKIVDTYNALHSADGKDIKVGADITVEYHGVVNEKAMTVSLPDKNSVTLDYTNDPTQVTKYSTTPPDIVTVYNFSINVDKYYMDEETPAPLAGAEFQLFTVSDVTGSPATDTDIATNNTAKAKRSFYKFTADTTVGVTDDHITQGSVTFGDIGDKILTNTAGNLNKSFVGLKPGTYYLVESKAPAGYTALEYPVKIVISEYDKAEPDNVTDGAVFSVYTYQNGAYELNNSFDTDGKLEVEFAAGNAVNIPVENKPGNALPTTGGMGTTIFYTVGAVMMLGALVLMITKKKMSAN